MFRVAEFLFMLCNLSHSSHPPLPANENTRCTITYHVHFPSELSQYGEIMQIAQKDQEVWIGVWGTSASHSAPKLVSAPLHL